MKRILLEFAIRMLEAASRPPKPLPRVRWY
jgi:hypothetical protein